MSIEMGYNLEPEQFEIIGEAIIDYLSNRKGIIKFLRKRGQVIDLEDEIPIPDLRYSRDLEDGEIGIKSILIHKYFTKIHRMAVIRMTLKIDKRLLDRWDNSGRQGMTLHDLKIHNNIKRFLDQIEQFLLRGTDSKLEFAVNDIHEDEELNCFFHGYDIGSDINIHEFRDLHEAVNNLTYELRKCHYNPPFSLMSDSKTLKWAKNKHFPIKDGIESYNRVIELNDIDKWIDLNGNADNSRNDDYNLVCIAKKGPFSNPIKIIEKSPLNIIPVNGGIVLYWFGGLETTENAIKQVKILH